MCSSCRCSSCLPSCSSGRRRTGTRASRASSNSSSTAPTTNSSSMTTFPSLTYRSSCRIYGPPSNRIRTSTCRRRRCCSPACAARRSNARHTRSMLISSGMRSRRARGISIWNLLPILRPLSARCSKIMIVKQSDTSLRKSTRQGMSFRKN